MIRYFFIILTFSAALLYATPDSTQSTPVHDTISLQADSASNNTTLLQTDSTIIPLQPQTPDSATTLKDTLIHKRAIDSLPDVQNSDSLKIDNTSFVGIGAGWGLGSFPMVKLWKQGLPDSLSRLGLTVNSFEIKPDTSLHNLDNPTFDTAQLKYTIKEQPNVYNMLFPVSLKVERTRPNDKFALALTYAFISKQFKATIIALDDTSTRHIDLKQRLTFSTLSLDFDYAVQIPSIYFSIDGVQKSYILFGAGITPLASIHTSTHCSAPKDDERLQNISKSINDAMNPVDAYGAGLSLKTGITTLRSLGNKNALEVGAVYSLTWFGYFRNNGNFISEDDITLQDKDNSKHLSFITNRVNLTFSLLHSRN